MNSVSIATDVLRAGGIILYPTDTVYGLGVDATNELALEKLIELKGRTDEKGFLVIVPDLDVASQYAEIHELVRKVATRLLPGALTFEVTAKEHVPDLLVKKQEDGRRTFGIRIPNNEFCLELAQSFGKPFVTTSANVSREKVESTVPRIVEQFGEKGSEIDYVVDIGELPPAQPSTLVGLSGDGLTVIREGAISKEQILAALDAH